MTCINCGTEVTSKFCPNCGQSNPPRRLTMGTMWSDFQARIYGFDGMFPRTLRDLTLRPGKASRSFIEGNRIQYYGPVGYFFLMITLMLLIMSMLDVNVVEFLKAAGNYRLQPEAKEGSGQQKLTESVVKIASDNLKLLSFAMIPLQAFCSRYLFFRKSQLNFLEHSVMPFYVQGHIYWISIFSVIYYKISGAFFPSWITPILAITYFCFAYAGFFNYQPKWKATAKGLGVYIVSQLIFAFIIAIVMIILVTLDPDVRELLKPSNNR